MCGLDIIQMGMATQGIFLNTYMLLSLDLFLHTLSFAALVAIWSGIVVWFANDLISGVSAGNYY